MIGGILTGIFGQQGAIESLFGSSGSVNENMSGVINSLTDSTESGISSSRLQIDEAGVNKAVQDILKDPSLGLANVVGQDRMSGLYGSSSAAFATNDLLDKIAGTIAQLTATKVDTYSKTGTQRTNQTQESAAKASTRKKGILGRLFSDARLKSNIMRIGTTPGGLPWYKYEIMGIPEEGVLAQDLLILLPDAVERHDSGYFMVDYSKVH